MALLVYNVFDIISKLSEICAVVLHSFSGVIIVVYECPKKWF